MKSLPSVSVVICAYNESKNIVQVLEAIISQQLQHSKLKEILVISDGSTDSTVEKVKKIRDKRLKIIAGKTRKGLTARLNTAFSRIHTDILVKIDADVLPQNHHLLEQLVRPFIANHHVGLVSGRLIPNRPTTYIENIILTGRQVWDKLRSELHSGRNVYACSGGIFAISQDLAKICRFPADIWADVGYLYLTCITHKFGFRVVPSAKVIFQLPQTYSDYIKQSKRYRGENDVLKKYFSPTLVEETYNIPGSLLIKYKMQAFMTHPAASLILFCLSIYANNVVRARPNLTSGWDSIQSTKKILETD